MLVKKLQPMMPAMIRFRRLVRVGQASQWNPHQHVEQREREPGQDSELRVGNAQVRLNGSDQHAQNRSVDERQHVDGCEYDDDEPGVTEPPRSSPAARRACCLAFLSGIAADTSVARFQMFAEERHHMRAETFRDPVDMIAVVNFEVMVDPVCVESFCSWLPRSP